MKFDELKAVAQKVEEPTVLVGEVLDMNEAFEALDRTPIDYDSDDEVIFARCPQCSSFSITRECARCRNHPKMIPVNFARITSQMETVGRVCSQFATGTCIEKIGKKELWCKDCEKFWDTEFSHRNTFQLPAGINEALLPRKTFTEVITEHIVDGEDEFGADDDDQEDWSDELEETQDNLDKACSLLINLKYLLEFLADKDLKRVIEPQDRREMYDYSTAISEVVGACGFDPEPYKEEADEVFNQQDKELLERMEADQERAGSQALNRMVDRITKFD